MNLGSLKLSAQKKTQEIRPMVVPTTTLALALCAAYLLGKSKTKLYVVPGGEKNSDH